MKYDKQVEQIKDQLGQLAVAIDKFQSVAVQTRVVDRAIKVLKHDKTANPDYQFL